jgi:hypothetical protein
MQLRALRISIGWNIYRYCSCINLDDTYLKLEGVGDKIDNLSHVLDSIIEFKDMKDSLCYIANDHDLAKPEDIRFMVGMRVSPHNRNDLAFYVSQGQYLSDEEYMLLNENDSSEVTFEKSHIWVELKDKDGLEALIDLLKANMIKVIQCPDSMLALSLYDDGKNNAWLREKCALSLKEQDESDYLLKFPFIYSFDECGDKTNHLRFLDIEPSPDHEFKGLHSTLDFSSGIVIKNQLLSTVIISQKDRDRLLKGKTMIEKYLNDALINLMLLW